MIWRAFIPKLLRLQRKTSAQEALPSGVRPWRTLLVLDIETIPDITVLPALTGETPHTPEEGRAMMEAYHLRVTEWRNAFPRQLFHRIVAAHALEVRITALPEGRERYHVVGMRCLGQTEASDTPPTEHAIVHDFCTRVGQSLPRLVTFGGRGFDIPVLRYRALKHGIAARWLYQSGDRWQNYMTRYAHQWHCDLLDVWSDYGLSARVRLQELCALCGIPGKINGTAAEVWGWHHAGAHRNIATYCATDVHNTYLLYLHTMHHRGVLAPEDYARALDEARKIVV